MGRDTSWVVSRFLLSLYLAVVDPNTPPDGIELMFIGLGFISVPITVIIYKRINAKRDALSTPYTTYTVQELHQMGDRAPDFRYTL
jgi:hypothetical protein